MSQEHSPSANGDSSPPAAKRSAVEVVKENSRGLRGTLAAELGQDTDHFGEADKQLLKFHGSYQQEDRDARKTRRKDGLGKHYMFMVRCKIPGGRLTAEQYLAVDDLAGKYGNSTLRITTRQGFQLHGILKSHLQETIAGINHCLLTTLGACGDVNRNVMVDPSPYHDNGLHEQLQQTGAKLAAHFAPRSGAYHDVWLNGRAVASGQWLVASEESGSAGNGSALATSHQPLATAAEEPIYGKVYLPRKFKIGLALPQNNLIDIYGQDLGLLAVAEGGRIVGYNVLVGGGMGMTHGNAETFPHLARPICYVPAEKVVEAAEAVVKLFRDHGNRENRKRARIKYLVHDWGVLRFREVLSCYLGGMPDEPRPVTVTGYDLCLGWHAQGNGRFWYGVSVENGRIKDEGSLRLRSALRRIMQQLRPQVRLSPGQDILLCDLPEGARPAIETILREHGVRLPRELPLVQQYSMACPAVPTCGLAISEAERLLPRLIDQLAAELERLGLSQEVISVRMTGCPNGCARPYQSDIGIVGRSGDKFTVFVGGRVLGDRLSFPLRDLVPSEQIIPLLVPLLEHFQKERRLGEGFGDFCHRLGAAQLGRLTQLTSAREG
jgi:sulfite reductase (ferredoxin)